MMPIDFELICAGRGMRRGSSSGSIGTGAAGKRVQLPANGGVGACTLR